jgi:hypothetical protein
LSDSFKSALPQGHRAEQAAGNACPWQDAVRTEDDVQMELMGLWHNQKALHQQEIQL